MGKKVGRKAGVTNVAVSERRNTIFEWVMDGKSNSWIIQECRRQYPNLSEKSFINDMSIAKQKAEEILAADRVNIIERHTAIYDKIIDRNSNTMGMEDTVIKAMQAKEKLFKLHNPDTAIQINNNNLDLSHLSVDELKKLLEDKS